MNKTINKFLSTMVLLALTLGSYVSVGASSSNAPQMAITTYYVSTSGKDTNAGTSAAPFRTIQKCAGVAGAGSTCSVAAGTYSERVNVTRSGIIFQANGKVTIQGFVISTSNTKVIGFYSLNSSNNSGAFYVNGSGNTIKNNIAEGPCMAGIVLNGNSNLAENNEIFKSRQCGGSGADADGMRVFGDGNVIRGNYVHSISKASNPTAHIDCIQNWGTLLNTIIEGNTCNVADAGIQTDVGNVRNITIRNNVFTASRPLNIRGEGLKITNNVFVGNAASSFVSLQSSSNVTFQNNIVYNTSDGILTSPGMITAGGYNIFYNSSGKAPRRDSGYSYVSGKLKWPTDKWQVNPMFVNPTAGDYRLKAGSPAIDTGLGGVDIGAFAYGGATSSVAATTVATQISITPIASTTPALPTSTVVTQPFLTATASSVPASPTTQPSASPIPATPAASAVPVQPTATSVPPTAVQPTATSVPPTAVPPTATAAQQSSETIYDDKSSSFVFNGWADVKIAQASNGSFKKATEAGSFATFTFTGQSFSVLYTAGPKFASVNVYIDDVLAGKIIQTSSATVYKKRWDCPKQLTSGQHTIKFVVVEDNGNVNGSIDAVIVR